MLKIQHLLVLVSISCLLSGCDPAAWLEPRPLDTADKEPKELPRWSCTGMLSFNRYLCQDDRQVVTVQLAHILLPDPGDPDAIRAIHDQTELSDTKLALLRAEILDSITNNLVGKRCRLAPEPLPGQSVCTSIIFLSSGIDLGSFFLQQGYALLAPGSRANAPDIYTEYQLRAIDFSRGIWKSPVTVGDRFTIDFTPFLRRFVERGTYAPLTDDLRRFHSPDLVRAPRYTGDSESEDEATIEMETGAHVTVVASGPPREYDLTLAYRPLVKANDYSGPLASFEPMELGWTEESWYIRGGETTTVELLADPLDVTKISRGASIEVYTGYIADGYEFKVLSGTSELYRTSGAFDPERTIKELSRSSTGLF